jgi:tetratricopeptide (TPR) repeat protein
MGKLLIAGQRGVQPKPFVACVFHKDSHDAPPVEPAETHPDKLVDFWEWLVEHRTQVSLAIIAALGIGMIVYVKKVGKIQDEELAAAEFDAAIRLGGSSTNLQRVVDDNPGTATAINASFLAASSLFDERAYDKAAMAFEKFYSSNPASALAPAALFGAAASWDAASQVEGAIKGYKNVVSQYRNSPEATQSRVALAKLYLAKSTPDTAEAKKLLDKVVADGQSDFISGFWEGEAQRLYDSLESGDKAIEAPIKLEQPGTSKNSGESGEPKKQPEKISPVPEKEENEKK